MKNNTLDKINKPRGGCVLIKQGVAYGFWVLAGILACQKGYAQFSNVGEVIINNGTILSVYEDYDNNASGTFTNDGLVYIFKNWNNNGIVDFTNIASRGTTFFNGADGQFIEGDRQSNFQNIQFDNSFENAPFYLGTKISVNNIAEFKNGIVNGIDLPGALMIFNENASHEKTSDKSFVDGKVQKVGQKDFQFPVGSDKFFRPTIHAASSLGNENIYTTQYFHKNSADLHSHQDKDSSIIEINDQEYWVVTQDQGTEKIVLSLTLDGDTTPAKFFEETKTTKLGIVRWDESAGMWVNDKGVLSQPVSGEAYERLLTNAVRGYGLFTMALVKNEDELDDLVVYNAISPNGDGINDTFHIEGIKQYPDNTVEIYNRWGVKVYDAKGYNETDKMFAGYSDGRATVARGEKLPTGTYFYILKYSNGNKTKEKSGYIYINNQ